MLRKIMGLCGLTVLLGTVMYLTACKNEDDGGSGAYTVTFDADGGETTPKPQTVLSGGTAINPGAVEKHGWKLAGWLTSDNKLWDFEEDKVYGDITLTAKWGNAAEIWVKIDSQGVFATATSINSVQYGNDRFIAVGNNGNFAYSTNGRGWTTIPSLSASTVFAGEEINDITYGNGTYVAVTNHGKIAYSHDGITWQLGGAKADSAVAFQIKPNTAIAGNTAIPNIFTDARIAEIKGGALATDMLFRGVAYGNNIFVAVGSGGRAAYSYNGILWNMQTIASGYDLYDVVYGGGKFVAVGESGTIRFTTGLPTFNTTTLKIKNTAALTADTWYTLTDTATFSTADADYAAGGLPSLTWSAVYVDDNGLGGYTRINAIAYGDTGTGDGTGTFVAVGAAGKMGYCQEFQGNTMEWTPINKPGFDGVEITGVAYSTSIQTFVAVGTGGKMAYSKMGRTSKERTWTAISPTPFGDSTVKGIVYGDASETFVAVGTNGKMAYSQAAD